MPKANERPLEELKERTMVNRPRFPRGLSSGCFGLILLKKAVFAGAAFNRSKNARFWRCYANSEADSVRSCFRFQRQRPTFARRNRRGTFSTESADSSLLQSVLGMAVCVRSRTTATCFDGLGPLRGLEASHE